MKRYEWTSSNTNQRKPTVDLGYVCPDGIGSSSRDTNHVVQMIL